MGHETRAVALSGLLLVASLSGCGDGGTSSGDGGRAPTVPNAAVGGLWAGTISPVNETADEVFGVVTEDGRAYFIDEWDQMYWGSISSSGDSLTGNLTVADIWGYSLWDESASAAVTVKGTVRARSSLTGTWDLITEKNSLKTGRLDLDYDPLYEEDSSLGNIAGNYVDMYGFDDGVVNIAANGQIFMQSPWSTCVVNGQVSIINVSYNAYDVQYEYSGCAPDDWYYNARFRGVAVYSSTEGILLLFAHRLNASEPEPVFLILGPP